MPVLLAVGFAPSACSSMNSSAGSDDNRAGTAGASGSLGGLGQGGASSAAAGGKLDVAGSAGRSAEDAGTAQGGDAGAESDAGAAGSMAGASGGCGTVVAAQALGDGIHVATCALIDYPTNPPSSGQHYPVWADFGVYDFPLPRGFWVHNLEHGAVVVTYHCPEGCASEVAAATAWLGQLSADAACAAGRPRVLLVPDPLLDVRWAASSWGFTLRSDCFDSAAFSDFYTQHVGQPSAPEALLCSPGQDLRLVGADTCGAH